MNNSSANGFASKLGGCLPEFMEDMRRFLTKYEIQPNNHAEVESAAYWQEVSSAILQWSRKYDNTPASKAYTMLIRGAFEALECLWTEDNRG